MVLYILKKKKSPNHNILIILDSSFEICVHEKRKSDFLVRSEIMHDDNINEKCNMLLTNKKIFFVFMRALLYAQKDVIVV